MTRNGVCTAIFTNMISLTLPALISVLGDRAHLKANLLRRVLFKADVGPLLATRDDAQIELELCIVEALAASASISYNAETVRLNKNSIIRTIDMYLRQWQQIINSKNAQNSSQNSSFQKIPIS